MDAITASERRGLNEKNGYPFLGSKFSFLMRLSENPKNNDFGDFYGLQVLDFITSENSENVAFGLFRQSLS